MIQLNNSEYGLREPKYSHYLYFQVSNRTNRFTACNSDRYSARQKELHDYIKTLHDSGMSYRRITKLLNKKGIKTHTGKEWSLISIIFEDCYINLIHIYILNIVL